MHHVNIAIINDVGLPVFVNKMFLIQFIRKIEAVP